VNPWIAHFFVFLMSVWGELSPPTSLTAAVSARIANASFLRTMYEALKLCIPITLMTFAIFTRSDMVVNPGWSQIVDTLLVTVSTLGITFAMFGRCFRNPTFDIAARILIAAVAFVVMFHPNDALALVVGIAFTPFVVAAIWRHTIIAPPKEALVPGAQPAGAPAPDLKDLLVEAKRELG
jgi:TRAP-type uncharacterized transport system fused permease subunit